MFHHFAYGMGGGGMYLMMFFWLLLIVGLAWLTASLVTRRQSVSTANPGEILEQRYARGELAREEYLLMKADLDSK